MKRDVRRLWLLKCQFGSDAVQQRINCLGDRERDILLSYCNKGITLKELSSRYGVSVTRISQIRDKAIRKVAIPLAGWQFMLDTEDGNGYS